MANLYFDRNDSTPLVAFKENGELLIEGRSLAEDPKLFYNLLFECVEFGV
jgi:hypothetical protein